jgi:hypothetical protein
MKKKLYVAKMYNADTGETSEIIARGTDPRSARLDAWLRLKDLLSQRGEVEKFGRYFMYGIAEIGGKV